MRSIHLQSLCMLMILLTCFASTGFSAPPAILVPAGFRVEHFADDDLAHDIHALTFDLRGRVVVSGPGYIRTLIDDDSDGTADRFVQFADGPATGAQGMCFMGTHLLCTGDDGLLLYRDENDDGIADGTPQTVLKMKTGGEHHAHSVQRGPDGWWYLIAGNHAGIDDSYVTLPTSAVKNPRAGVLMRLKPDLTGGEILADGYRNAYDFAFNLTGVAFTFDSDGERDVSLPWYQPPRVIQMTPGSDAGWVSRSWKRPDAFADMPPVLASFGRSSPAGMICYRHHGFPSRYDGALLMLDWSFGRILAVSVSEDGANWKGAGAEFAKANGRFGFAPTDLEVAPDGSVYVAVGGRGTRGSVYRIVHNDSANSAAESVGATSSIAEKLDFVLDAPQPLAAWSRARWYPIAKELGREQLIAATLEEGRRPVERIRSIEVLVDAFGGIDAERARKLTAARSVPVRARLAWAVGRSDPESPDAATIDRLLIDEHPLVQRNALEALLHATDSKLFDRCLPRLAVTLDSSDAGVRYATSRVMRRLTSDQVNTLQALVTHSARSQVWMQLGLGSGGTRVNLRAAKVALAMLQRKDAQPDQKLEAIRLLQIALGDVGPQKGISGMMESYTARASLERHQRSLNPVRAFLVSEFPSSDVYYDRELLRTIAMLEVENTNLIDQVLQQITESSVPADDIHRLAVIAKTSGTRSMSQTATTAAALINLEHKVLKMNLKQDSNWDDRLAELYTQLADADSRLPEVIAENEQIGLPGHVFLLRLIPAERLQTAIDGFARQIDLRDNYRWTNDVVFVLGRSSNPEHLELLSQQASNLSVQDAVVIVLSRKPRAKDRQILLSGLESTQVKVTEVAAAALSKLPKSNDAAEQIRLLRAAERLDSNEREFAIRETLMRLLQNNLQQSFGFVFGKDGYHPQPEAFTAWRDYLSKRFPGQSIDDAGDSHRISIVETMKTVDWASGAAGRGEALFDKLSCRRCHGGRKALGPDLNGVAKRFSRSDLFEAIVDPDRDVSDRYQLTTVQTTDGRQFSGLVVYDSVDGIVLRDAQQNTVRIEAEDIETKARRRVSLMPSGLLKDVDAQGLADLDAFLQKL